MEDEDWDQEAWDKKMKRYDKINEGEQSIDFPFIRILLIWAIAAGIGLTIYYFSQGGFQW